MASQAFESAKEKVPPGISKDCFSSPVSSTKVQELKHQKLRVGGCTEVVLQ